MKKSLAKTVAFIPVRGGSKSIPLKNIKELKGKPLVCWAIDAALQTKNIDLVVVSTDSKEIKSVVEERYATGVKLISRSEAVSTDIASTESVMLEFASNFYFENIMLLQATSPLIKAVDLDNGMSLFNQDGVDSVLSVVRQKRFLWEEDHLGDFHPVNYEINSRPRRQDFNGFLVENGAFYITSRMNFLNSKCRLSGRIKVIEMSDESYFEIDEPSDWCVIESLLKKQKEI